MGIWIARDGKSYGPYEDQQIRQWISEGTISVADLALRDGDSNWVPLTQILSTTPSSPDDWINDFSTRKSGSTQVPPYASRGSRGPLGNARRRASQLPESTRASYLYAGFWLRLVAYLVDLVIVMLSSLVLGFLAGLALAGHLNNNDLRLTGFAIGLIWGWLYFAVCESSSWQGTPGKLALGLVVTDLSGKRIGFGRATGRYLGKIISGGILLIGYLMAGWTVRRQALHDLMAGAYVVRKKGLLAFENLEASHDAEVAPRMSAGAIVGMVLAVLFVLVIAPVLAAIAIPAYQSYVIRSQVAEGEVLADSAKTALVEYYENKGEFPGNNSLAGLASAGSINGKYVTSVDASHGRILVTYGNTASEKISGNHLVLVPTPDGGSVSWKCGSPELKVSYLPQDCRSDMSNTKVSTSNSSASVVSPSISDLVTTDQPRIDSTQLSNQDRAIREQVKAGAIYSDDAKTAVAEYYANNGSFPADNASAGLAPSESLNSDYVASLLTTAGEIVVTYGNKADQKIRDTHLVFTAQITDGQLSWTCISEDIAGRYLPQNCDARKVPELQPADAPTCAQKGIEPPPSLVGMPYGKARDFLIASGYALRKNSDAPDLAASENLDEQVAAGFFEAKSCSAAGMERCNEQFTAPNGASVSIIVEGEQDPQIREVVGWNCNL